MKTTVELADHLLIRAKERAAERGTTLRALLEEGLRRVLEEPEGGAPFVLREASVSGYGVQPGVEEGNWEQWAGLIYEDRPA